MGRGAPRWQNGRLRLEGSKVEGFEFQNGDSVAGAHKFAGLSLLTKGKDSMDLAIGKNIMQGTGEIEG